MRLAELLEDFADGAARRRLYLVIGIEERQPEPHGTAAAKRGFARPHQPDEDDRAIHLKSGGICLVRAHRREGLYTERACRATAIGRESCRESGGKYG